MSVKLLRAQVGLLALQFVLGMLANLYQTINSAHPSDVFRQWGFIMAHSLNAGLVLVLAVVLLWQAVKRRSQIGWASWGLSGIVVAFLAGHLFVANQSELYSLAMSLGFILSFAVYLYQLALASRRQTIDT